MNMETFRRGIYDHRIAFALGLAILVSLMLTFVSLSLYIRSGASRLDLSRPGYEAARQQLISTVDQDSFSANGPVDAKSLKEFQTLFDKRRTNLNKLDPFSPTVVDNESLRLLQ